MPYVCKLGLRKGGYLGSFYLLLFLTLKRDFDIKLDVKQLMRLVDVKMIILDSQSVAFGDYLRGLPAGASLRSANPPAARFARPPPPTARSARQPHPHPHHR